VRQPKTRRWYLVQAAPGIHAATLTRLIDLVSSGVEKNRKLKIDMADVRELHTLGAWLLEKILRGASDSGHPATLVGTAPRYEGLIEDIRQVNRRKPASRPIQNPVLKRLETIGRSASASRKTY
jgi:phospholipid/cholesterol/gamma-HCH transport system permease protein